MCVFVCLFVCLFWSIFTEIGKNCHMGYACQTHLTTARCSSVVRAFAHGAMGRLIDPSCGGLIELFLVPANAPRLV